MINLTEILLYKFRDNLSSSKISNKTGYSKTTIIKYKREFEKFRNKYINENNKIPPTDVLIEKFVYLNGFKKADYEPRVITKEVINEIDNYIKENNIKRATGLKKQTKRKNHIYQKLMEKGYNISYSSVCKYITKKYGKNISECFIKQQYELGYTSEFDWGEVKLYINDKKRTFRMAEFAMAGSNTRWGQLFQHENTLSFQEAHVGFFRYMNGIPFEVVYDNMKVAVKRLAGDKKPTLGLMNLMNHYCFQHRFCQIRRGNQKGHVERGIDYLRREAFNDEDHFSSIEEANEHLRKWYEKLNNKPNNISLLKNERKSLIPYTTDYQCSVWDTAKIDKLSTFSYDRTHYSVPDRLVGKTVDIKIYSDKIEVYYNKEEICSHDRCYNHTWMLTLDHYLKTLSYKPGALKHSLTLHQAPSRLKDIYKTYFSDDNKNFVELLLFVKNNGLNYQDIYNAIDELKTKNITNINVFFIRSVLDNTDKNYKLSLCNKNLGSKIENPIESIDIEKYTVSNISKLTTSMQSKNY
ncbi:MAG: IS21 family transposase [Bacilli bacterium]